MKGIFIKKITTEVWSFAFLLIWKLLGLNSQQRDWQYKLSCKSCQWCLFLDWETHSFLECQMEQEFLDWPLKLLSHICPTASACPHLVPSLFHFYTVGVARHKVYVSFVGSSPMLVFLLPPNTWRAGLHFKLVPNTRRGILQLQSFLENPLEKILVEVIPWGVCSHSPSCACTLPYPTWGGGCRICHSFLI